jgi:hypothetical protein
VALLSAIPRWILVVLVVLLLIFVFSLVRTATIGEGSDSPSSTELAVPEFMAGLVPSPAPVAADEVIAPECRTGAQLQVLNSCDLLVEPSDERRRLTLVVEQGDLQVTIRYVPDEGEDDPESYPLPHDDEERAEFSVPDDRQLRVHLTCPPLSQCILRIEGG